MPIVVPITANAADAIPAIINLFFVFGLNSFFGFGLNSFFGFAFFR